jgi:glycerol uptake facilitator-like aquaporin
MPEGRKKRALNLTRRTCAEAFGAMLLAATVIGSGIMAERLSAGNSAIALLANTGATVAALAVLIAMLGPLSGAHFNPAVSLVETLRGNLRATDALAYIPAQIAGCILGALLAHAMFELPLIQSSAHIRAGNAQWLSEAVATGGLVIVILGSANIATASWRVPAWIGAAYWFTASTSFANPAITIGRALSDSFAGIRPADAPMFITAQLVGALAGLGIAKFLFARPVQAMESGAKAENS